MDQERPLRYFPRDVLKEGRQDRQKTSVEIIRNALYDKGYRRGQTYTPRGSLQPIGAFTVYIRGERLILLMEHTDGGCEVLQPVCALNDIEQTIAAIP